MAEPGFLFRLLLLLLVTPSGGDPLNTVLVIISALIALVSVLTLANVFLLIRKTIRGERLDPELTIFSVLGLLSIIALSASFFLFIRGKLFLTVAVIIIVFIIFVSFILGLVLVIVTVSAVTT